MKLKFSVILIVALILNGLNSQAQKIRDLDLTLIKSVISVPNSPYEYARLKTRMFERDTTLTPYEFQLLYYGLTFQPEYAPYFPSPLEEKFNDLYSSEDFNAAFPLVDSILFNNPVNLRMLLRAAVCARVLGDEKLSESYISMYSGLFNTIVNSGNGWSEDQSMIVVCVNDEYEIMKMWEIGYTKQALLASKTDCFTLDKATRKDLKKHEIKTKNMYFDVSIPFSSLSREFENSMKQEGN
jgi:hypothetical protein